MSNKQLNQKIGDYLRSVVSSEAVAQEHLFGTGAVAKLERKIAAYYGMKHALCVANATTGLFAIALALNLKNAEFITTPYTYGASLASWLMLGNRAVFADIDAQTLTLNPEKIKNLIAKKTKAILTVDIFGNPSDISALRKIADNFGIPLIADCAQSLGAKRNDFPAGYLADALVVSFTSGKTLFAGEGGAVITNNTKLYERLLFYSQHPFRQKREIGLGISNEFAFNARIHPLAAIWANADCENALTKLKTYQTECLEILAYLNKSGLIQPARFSEKDILPSFLRLTVEQKELSDGKKIESYLAKRNFKAKTASVPVSLIYQNAAFLAQYKRQFSLPKACLQAERQARQRIGLVLTKNSGGNNK